MKRWGSTHDRMKACLTPEAFDALVREFGGELVRIPTRVRETRNERTDRIVKLLDSNTWRDTAEQAGCSQATVARAVRAAD